MSHFLTILLPCCLVVSQLAESSAISLPTRLGHDPGNQILKKSGRNLSEISEIANIGDMQFTVEQYSVSLVDESHMKMTLKFGSSPLFSELGRIYQNVLCPARRCPIGFLQSPTPGFVGSINGCGPMDIDPSLKERLDAALPPQFQPCCDLHDSCYDLCGQDKYDCEVNLQSCLLKVCEQDNFQSPANLSGTKLSKRSFCRVAALAIVQATSRFGCLAFWRAQSRACTCVQG